MTTEPKTTQHIIMLEVSHIVTGDQLHELLCTGLLEQDQDALNDLQSTVHDIQVVGPIEVTG